MSTQQVTIPDVGDVDEVEVIEICVEVGDSVDVDDALVVIESDKASMDVPSPHAGTVRRIALSVGDRVKEGDLVVELDAAQDAGEDDDEGGGKDDAEDDAKDSDENDAKDGDDAGDEDGGEDGDEDTASGADGDRSAVASAEDDETTSDSGGTGADARVEEVRVPDVGDASDVTVVEIMVAVGDSVEADDGLVALESDKATMEVPAPQNGKILSIDVSDGDVVSEGTLVATLEISGAAAKKDTKDKDEAAPKRATQSTSKSTAQETSEQPSGESKRSAPSASAGESARPAKSQPSAPTQQAAEGSGKSVYAGPAVRRLARELGVELTRVSGSGHRGRIVKEDVHEFVKQALGSGETAQGAGIPEVPEIDFSRFGEVEIRDASRMMKAGARNLHRSWLNVPHVTQHDEADVTDLERFRRSLKDEAQQRGVKLTPLPLLVRAVQAALAEFPRFNGSFVDGGERYAYKRYFHVGFAVDTPEGLLVPVLRDVDRKGIWELAEEIGELSERARDMKLKPDEMRGACMTISSLGAIGGTGFTPIVNAPEVAILGVSRLTRKPVWQDGEFVPRDMLPLSLSYDHRAINGAEAGRFMTWLCQALSDMRRVLL